MVDQVPQPLFDMGESLKFNLKNGHYLASLILMYCYINAMASLIMPEKQKDVTGEDFKKWVNKYMKADSNQQYQYRGIDLWGARCALVHRYSPHSKLSDKRECKLFEYIPRGNHIYDSSKSPNEVKISVTCIVNDFYKAMKNFLLELMRDEELRKRADRRFRKFFKVKPL